MGIQAVEPDQAILSGLRATAIRGSDLRAKSQARL